MHHPRYTTALPKRRLGLFVQVVVVDLRAVAGSLVGSSRLWVVFTFLNVIDLSLFVTSPLWSEWEISVDRSTQLLHNRRNQSRQDLSLLSGFKNIIIFPVIITISYVADAARWVCWHSDILQLGSHCCSLCRVSCKDRWIFSECAVNVRRVQKVFFLCQEVWLKPAGETKIGRGRSSNSSKDDLSVVLGEFDLSTQSDEFDINR